MRSRTERLEVEWLLAKCATSDAHLAAARAYERYREALAAGECEVCGDPLNTRIRTHHHTRGGEA